MYSIMAMITLGSVIILRSNPASGLPKMVFHSRAVLDLDSRQPVHCVLAQIANSFLTDRLLDALENLFHVIFWVPRTRSPQWARRKVEQRLKSSLRSGTMNA